MRSKNLQRCFILCTSLTLWLDTVLCAKETTSKKFNPLCMKEIRHYLNSKDHAYATDSFIKNNRQKEEVLTNSPEPTPKVSIDLESFKNNVNPANNSEEDGNVKEHFVVKAFQMIAEDREYQNSMKDLSDKFKDGYHNSKLIFIQDVSQKHQSSTPSKERYTLVEGNVVKATQKAGRKSLEKAIKISSVLKEGLDFNFDLGNIGNSNHNPEKASVDRKDSIYYGLELVRIEPAKKDLLTADNMNEGSVQPFDLNQVPKAKVIYKIVPKKREVHGEKPISSNQKTSSWVPSTKVKGNVKIKDSESADKLEGSLIPNMMMALTQEDQLYTIEYHSVNGFNKDKINHKIAFPIQGTLSIEHAMDEDFKPLKSSAHKLLIYEDAAPLNLHYLNPEGVYQGDLGISEGDGFDINFKASSRATKVEALPKYELSFTSHF